MYYIAVLCPPEINEKILQYKQWMKTYFGCVIALRSPAHITLIPPFWANDELEKTMIRFLNEFTIDVIPEIDLEGFDHFGRRVLFVNVNENPDLEEIHERLETGLITELPGLLKPDTRPFHPHVTIATRDMSPEAFEKAWDYFSPKKVQWNFPGNHLALLRLGKEKWEIIFQKQLV